MCKKAKEDWMEERCKEIKDLEQRHAHSSLYQKIKTVTKLKKGYSSRGGFVDKNGKEDGKDT